MCAQKEQRNINTKHSAINSMHTFDKHMGKHLLDAFIQQHAQPQFRVWSKHVGDPVWHLSDARQALHQLFAAQDCSPQLVRCVICAGVTCSRRHRRHTQTCPPATKHSKQLQLRHSRKIVTASHSLAIAAAALLWQWSLTASLCWS